MRFLTLAAAVLALTLSCSSDRVPFHGAHQAGIATPVQKFGFVAAFDVTSADAGELRRLLRRWTELSASLTAGRLEDGGVPTAPPRDTGEARGLSPARLTLTFGAGPSLFDGRFGLADRRPAALVPLPAFAGDQLKAGWSDGDLVVQAAADDYAVAYHALHQLERAARGTAVLRWVQAGFTAPRNLQGFLDGTENPDVTKQDDLDRVVWAGADQGWIEGGSYLVVRRIRMLVETWDRSSLRDQEKTIGRERTTGTILTAEADDAHRKLARGDGSQKILRRPFSYVNGLDPQTNQWDAGLLFLAWMKNPQDQFVPMQTRLAGNDRLNEYIKTQGSAVFAVFPGVPEGGVLGAGLFPAQPLAQRIEGLLAPLGGAFAALSVPDWTTVKAEAAAWDRQWRDLASEAGPRAADLNRLQAAWTEALSAEGPDAAAVRRAQTALSKAVSQWHDASQPSGGSGTDLGVLKARMADLERLTAAGGGDAARKALAAFQKEWTAREALVRSIDPAVYSSAELGIGTLRSALAAEPASEAAKAAAAGLKQKLNALEPPKKFGPFDVGALLMREGLEALLVLGALLAFLGKTDQRRRTPWVWTGAGAGLAASLGVALLISVFLGPWASAAPALVEGLVGMAAVVLMLMMGGWLHSKATVKTWNTWFKDKMGRTNGRPWALATLAFAAVLREGAETVVFLWGLAGSLSPGDLALGLAGGLAVLAAVGVAMLGFSKRLPLNWFFPIATGLIYFLAVKILGQSVTALQAAGWLPSTALGFAGPVDWLGFSPTWQTAAAQAVLLTGLTVLLARSIVKGHRKPAPKPATT